jgi:dTDP-4-dehydrorhamnose reductase
VVEDQVGCPTYAADLAEAILDLSTAWSSLSHKGIFHLAAAGEASWFAFAQQIFELSAVRGGPTATVQPIKTAEYPTIARRPLNSRLDCTRLRNVTGIILPHWRDALERCIEKLLGSKSRNAFK